MSRSVFGALLALTIVTLLNRPSHGQEWARKMFSETSHDFGTVARGAKVEHRFKIKNLYVEDIHIVGVRTSCGCTTPSLTKNVLKTWETGEVVARFNTPTFQGYRSATLTVTIDKPMYAEVQLHVSGNIRTDIVVHPGFVDLGSVDLGQSVEKKVAVLHAGRPDWRIVDVRSANDNFEVEILQTKRSGSDVAYDLLVRLKESAPAGYIKEQLMLVTNDQRVPQFPVDVEGRVVPALTVSPASLALGTVTPGKKVSKNLVIRGKSPFKITNIHCQDPQFTFKLPDVAREIHLVPVTFTAGNNPGRILEKIRIETDLGKGMSQEIMAQAVIEEPAPDVARPDSPAPEDAASSDAAVR